MTIILGCAQFGAAYGRVGTAERLNDTSLCKIINKARDFGIEYLDTAAAYGDSEVRLGQTGIIGFNVITKISGAKLSAGMDLSGRVESQIKSSLARLNLTRTYCVLIHDYAELREENRISLLAALNGAKKKGLVEKIGVSIYSPEDLTTHAGELSFDVVQAPVNVFDSRVINSALPDLFSAAGIELHARSIFLQGLLLMHSNERPKYFRLWSKALRLWDEFCADLGISKLKACQAFLIQSQQVAKVVVGVDSEVQLEEIIQNNIMSEHINFPEFGIDPGDILIDPRKWQL